MKWKWSWPNGGTDHDHGNLSQDSQWSAKTRTKHDANESLQLPLGEFGEVWLSCELRP